MKKIILLVFVSLLLSFHSYGRPVVKGVIVKNVLNIQLGDTITVFGARVNSSGIYQYCIAGYEGVRFVNSEKIKLVNDDQMDFWDKLFFNERAVDIKSNGWASNLRQELHLESQEYHQQAIQGKTIYEDAFLYDYIYQLLVEIHPKSIDKDIQSSLGLLIIKSNEQHFFTFDDGMIIITTGLLASCNNKKELVELLVQAVAHIRLDHNLLNLQKALRAERNAAIWGMLTTAVVASANSYYSAKNDIIYDPYLAIDAGMAAQFLASAVLESIGAKYSKEQIDLAINTTKKFKSLYPKLFEDDNLFKAYMSEVMSYTAWQEYHSQNYLYSRVLVNRLIDNGLASSSDYVLLAKIIRKTENTQQSNLEALSYLDKASLLAFSENLDILKETAFINMRLGETETAKQFFEKYIAGLIELENKGVNVLNEVNSVKQFLLRCNMTSINSNKTQGGRFR